MEKPATEIYSFRILRKGGYAHFEGRRDLFQGLAIEPKWDWTKRWPVLYLDMGGCRGDTEEEVWAKNRARPEKESERLNAPLREDPVPVQFAFLINDLARHQRAETVA